MKQQRAVNLRSIFGVVTILLGAIVIVSCVRQPPPTILTTPQVMTNTSFSNPTLLPATSILPTVEVITGALPVSPEVLPAISPTPLPPLISTSTPIPELVLYEAFSYCPIAFAYSPDSRYIAMDISSGDVPGIQLINLDTDKVEWTSNLPDYQIAVAFSPDGTLVAAGGRNGVIYLLDAHSGKRLSEQNYPSPQAGNQGGGNAIRTVAFSPDGKYIFAGSCNVDQGLIAWDFKSDVITRFSVPGVCDPITLSPNHPLLATGYEWLVNYKTGKFDMEVKTKDLIYFVTFSPDGGIVAARNVDKQEVELWDFAAETKLDWSEWKKYQTDVKWLAWSSQNALALLSKDGTIVVWNMTERRAIGTARLSGAQWLEFSPDGAQLASFGVVTDKPAPLTIWLIPK